MKTSLLSLACLSLLAALPLGHAAEGKSSPELITTSPPVKPPPPVSINVDFPGGTISQLLAAIPKNGAVSFNIIDGNDTTDFNRVELPAFSLRNVPLITVIQVLQQLLEQRGFSLRPIGGENPNSWVCILVRNGKPSTTKTTQPTQFNSYQLTPYLSEQSVDDIVGAIHAAWELDPAHDREALRVKFHAPTSVLLVSGPDEAINITVRVINNLKRSSQKPKPDQPDARAIEAEKK